MAGSESEETRKEEPGRPLGRGEVRGRQEQTRKRKIKRGETHSHQQGSDC